METAIRENLSKEVWIKKARTLTQALVISGTLNLGLLSTFIYFALTNRGQVPPLSEIISSEKHPSVQLHTRLVEYALLSYSELLARLESTQQIESGYVERDLAISCLVGLHQFNLERALGGTPLEGRLIPLATTQPEATPISLLYRLTDEQYLAIRHYAEIERCPFTAAGLFSRMQAGHLSPDSPLIGAFYLTAEFHFFHSLFSKTGVPLKKEHLIALLLTGDWSLIEQTATELKGSPQFCAEQRRFFLLRLIENSSRLAAKILLESDLEYCLKSLVDCQILHMCNLLGEQTNPLFLKQLLVSGKNEEVAKKGAELLYELAAEPIPIPIDLAKAKRRFIELRDDPDMAKPDTNFNQSEYVVEPGDSLWKISRKYRISIDQIIEVNRLKNDKLQIGQKLTIPKERDRIHLGAKERT